MAIVAHTPYTGTVDAARTNEYITDGHGLPEADRTNRYITDGHGGHTICEGYNCPADPTLATEYMETVRLNYERQHPPGEGRTKGSVTHEQIYVSPTEEDNVPVEERMQMTRELIERTPLRDFPSIYCPHDNTHGHCHISLCPYSVDGTHKLSMNNALLNDLRREMDRICVEHGYSIIENPELWADKEYRDWFFRIKEEGVVKIHPPKEQDMTEYKRERKRARTYSASKQSQALRQEKMEKYYKQMTQGYKPETADFFYTAPHLYNPHDPRKELHIKKIVKDGREAGEMELAGASLFVWAYQSAKEIERRNIKGSTGLQKRMQALANKALSATELMKKLDIRTHEELIGHIKECGQDIADLKKEVKRQTTIIDRMADVMDAIDRWENAKDPDAYAYLKSHRCGTPEEIADAKKRYARAVGRKAADEALLQERSTEYRHLKEAESTIHPASSEELWHDYLEQMFTKEIAKKVGYVDPDKLEKQAYQMGKVAGLSREEVDVYLAKANTIAQKTTWVEYRQFMMITFTQENGAITAVYDRISEAYEDIRELREMSRSMPVLGPFTLLLSIAVAFYAGYEEAVKEREIEELRWEAARLKEYAKQERMRKQEELKTAKTIYALEVMNASEEEIAAAQVRFYKTAAKITGRLDILMEIDYMQSYTSLDSKIADAVSKTLKSNPAEYDDYIHPNAGDWRCGGR